MGLHHVLCAVTLPGMVLYKLFLDIRVPPSLAGVMNPMKNKRLRSELGPVNPMRSITGKGGWAEVTLQPPPTSVAFRGFCDVVKVTTIHKLI